MQQQHEQDLLNVITREKARGVRLKLPSAILVKYDKKENKLEETSRHPKVTYTVRRMTYAPHGISLVMKWSQVRHFIACVIDLLTDSRHLVQY
jgi:hypothetical protein